MVPWIINGLGGVIIMFALHIIKTGKLSKPIMTDITGKHVVIAGILSTVLYHIGSAVLGDKEVIVWAIITVPMLSFYSVALNALVAAVFNTINYETNKRKSKSETN